MSDDNLITHENYLNSTYIQNEQNRNNQQKRAKYVFVVWLFDNTPFVISPLPLLVLEK
jgi:hypothetical protein